MGHGWLPRHERELDKLGYALSFDRMSLSSVIPRLYGLSYALLFKALRQEEAFGHSNPYHRYAFNPDWLYRQTEHSNLCEIHYSYWARLATACPKVVVVHDLWSDLMWEGHDKETKELQSADLVVTLSHDDTMKLRNRGLTRLLWSPPCVSETRFEDSGNIAIVGSANRHNLEGLKWLKGAIGDSFPVKIHVYGELGRHIGDDERFVTHAYYRHWQDPYRDCGIVMMLTKNGSGIQIKGVEALAGGRAVVARSGAMRGLPKKEEGWLETETPEEMLSAVIRLQQIPRLRKKLAERAKEYYKKYLNSQEIIRSLKENYLDISAPTVRASSHGTPKKMVQN